MLRIILLFYGCNFEAIFQCIHEKSIAEDYVVVFYECKKTDVTKIQCVAFNFCVAERTFSYLTTKTVREAEIIFDTIAKVYCFTVYEKRLISLWTNPKDFSFKFIDLIQVYTLY